MKEGREQAMGTPWRRSLQAKEVQRSWNKSISMSWRNNKEIRSTFAKKPSSGPIVLPQTG